MKPTKHSTRRSALALVVAALLLAPAIPSTAFAFDEASTAAINVDASGLAIRGYDPVAYFTVGRPTEGDAAFTATHDGATYRFASAANRDAFVADPARYAPAFGGFCAMGAALERKFDGDPNQWKVVDGKLYLNVSEPTQKRWLQDVPGNVTKAMTNWPKIRDKAPNAL